MIIDAYQLLKLLSDGEFHSGQMLAKHFNVSRAAICLAMDKIKAYGYVVESRHGKGYRLCDTADLLDIDTINQALPPSWNINILATVDSTNNHLLAQLESFPSNTIQVCLAEQQTAGRGRRGRAWHSPFGKNLYCSLLWPFEQGVTAFGGLSLAVAISLVKQLKSLGANDLRIKWPNDILWQGKKLAGILIDLRGDIAGPCYAVIGIGINVIMQESSAIDQVWTSLHRIIPSSFSRNTIAIALLQRLNIDLSLFSRAGFAAFINDWASYDALFEQKVQVQMADQLLSGTAMGVNMQGDLRIEDNDKKTRWLSGGEVSVRQR